MSSPIARLRGTAARTLLMNASSMLVGQGSRALLQGAYFAVAARALGADGFGAFAAATAVVALATPFGSLGAVNLMIRNLVNAPGRVADEFATALVVTTAAGVAVSGILIAGWSALGAREVSLTAMACIAWADLLGARLIDVAGGVHIASERMSRTAGYQVWLHSGRLAAALALWASPATFDVQNWAVLYLASSSVVCVLVLTAVVRRFGRGRPDFRQFSGDWREGLLFSFSLSSQSIYNDIDKAMLARMSTLDAAGIYTAAYKVVDLAFVPMRALLGAAYPRFFRQGRDGLRSGARLARRLAIPGAGYSVFAAVALWAGADLVPLVLGDDYSHAPGVIRALSVIPIVRTVHYLAGDTLTGSGSQGARTLAQIAAAGLNVGLNLALIPIYGYWGAVVASLATDVSLALCLWSIIVVRLRVQSKTFP